MRENLVGEMHVLLLLGKCPLWQPTKGHGVQFLGYPMAGGSQKNGWDMKLLSSALKQKGKSSQGMFCEQFTLVSSVHPGRNNLELKYDLEMN